VPKKHLGQHFLSDPDILQRIVGFSRVNREDTVVEIGPGRGNLTKALAGKVRRVVAIELDRDLISFLRGTVGTKVEILERDALEVDFTTVCETRYHVVANLPYNIATPLILKLIAARAYIDSITVMLQQEVADRMLAAPGGRQYGALSVGTQYYAMIEGGFTVPPGAFTPPPKVHSRMLRMTWNSNVADSPEFIAFVRRAFASRRKKLVNNLSPLFPGRERKELLGVLVDEGIDENARPEDLSVEAFVRLHRTLVYNLRP
jgi:16S rRNA (adenine1518-N6/adenine1519-N6)-dimethyltransferase